MLRQLTLLLRSRTCLLTAASDGVALRAGPASRFVSSSSEDSEVKRKGMVNKLLYRSRQRGFLELDLIVGLWAEKEVPHMQPAMLTHFSAVLDMENPDLFKWLTGQMAAPEDVLANPAYMALRRHVQEQLGQHSHLTSQAAPGKTWVRGWDDGWKKTVPDSANSTAGQQ